MTNTNHAMMPALAVIAGALIFAFISPAGAQALGAENTTSSPSIINASAYDWFMKGMDMYYQEDYNDSLQAYDRALELDPNDYEAWNNRGIDLGIMGRYDEAIASLEQAVALNDTYAEAWYNLGVIYEFKGYYYTAVQAYKKATQINPEYQKAWERRNVGTDAVMARSLSCACTDQIAQV